MVSAVSKQPRSIKDEIAELDRYLRGCREQGQRNLQALRTRKVPQDLAAPHHSNAGESPKQLQAEIDALRSKNADLLTQQHHLQTTLAAHAQDDVSSQLQALQSKCSRLESELAASRMAVLTGKGSRAQSERTECSTNGAQAAPAPPPPATTAWREQIVGMQSQIAQLRQDRDEVEEQVVNMYEGLFKDDIISGLVSVVRRKEIDLVASLDSGSGGAAAGSGKRNGFAKPAPRLKAKLDEATERVEKLERELKSKAAEMDAAERHHADMLKIATVESTAQAEHFKGAWEAERARRKELHQRVLELKGAIRVFCRVRPLTRIDGDEAVSSVAVKDSETLSIAVPTLDDRRRAASAPLGSNGQPSPPRLLGRDHTYEFDRVFGPQDAQDAVYEDVSDLITSVADGFNVCILAYGQTGSGKTYTMQGTPEAPGINMRALRELFSLAEARKDTQTMYVQASILEIYNDTILDLLSESPRATADKLEIKEMGGHIWIPSLSMVKVHSVGDVEALVARGDKGRSTFATDMNEHSSRSHLILSLYVRTDNTTTGEKTASKLHLIDLAGSERVSRSHAEGERLSEAQSINKSLSALGDVIQSLKAHSAHVPYRNCKLTRLLSDSLGGRSKTLLVVNLSPTRDSAAESRCSCEFASRAKRVELGAGVRQVEGGAKGGNGGPVNSAASVSASGTTTPTGSVGPVRPASVGASSRHARRISTTPDLQRAAARASRT